tara:strand:- start:10754 stop:10969 length:216 start_codon:yes stop_codon:yes gene_type:complete
MSSDNPFTALLPADPPPMSDKPAAAVYEMLSTAETLWDLLDGLPVKAEAKLAQRRLQEMVFWGTRAAGGTS